MKASYVMKAARRALTHNHSCILLCMQSWYDSGSLIALPQCADAAILYNYSKRKEIKKLYYNYNYAIASYTVLRTYHAYCTIK